MKIALKQNMPKRKTRAKRKSRKKKKGIKRPYKLDKPRAAPVQEAPAPRIHGSRAPQEDAR